MALPTGSAPLGAGRVPDRAQPVDHLSFGHGPHVCAGRGLAKLEIYAVLDALARRVRRLRIGEPTRRLGNSTRSYHTLPVLEIEPA